MPALLALLAPSQYQARAELAFRSIASQLSALLPRTRIEHVGASSIPGAISKGDLDICVLVASSHHQTTVDALEGLGYVIKTDTLRTPELCMLVSPRKDMDVALQVVSEGSRFEFFLHFRDRLRAEPRLVAQYNQLKRRFAPSGPERYRRAKDRFIQRVIGSPQAPQS
jgi:GrpB-like predicted nucleotidyltransferase (UPF0157 family)